MSIPLTSAVATMSPRQLIDVVMQHAMSGRTREPSMPRGKVWTQRKVPAGADVTDEESM